MSHKANRVFLYFTEVDNESFTEHSVSVFLYFLSFRSNFCFCHCLIFISLDSLKKWIILFYFSVIGRCYGTINF